MAGYAKTKLAEALESEENDDEEVSQSDILNAVTELAKRSRTRSTKKNQTTPLKKGERYQDFECYLCSIPRGAQILVPDLLNPGRQRSAITKVIVTERVRLVKIEPHLVYGLSEYPYTPGFNDQIVTDLGIPVQLYFPVRLNEKGEKIDADKFGVKEGDELKATTIKILVNQRSHGRDNICERTFNVFEYRGGKTLKEMVADLKEKFEWKRPEVVE